MGKRKSILAQAAIKNKAIVLIGAFLAGAALGLGAAWTMGVTDTTSVQVLEGLAWVNDEGTGIGLSPDGESAGPGYVVAGALWREPGGAWHDGFPTCLEPLTLNQRVRLGVLQADPSAEAPGRPVVVWLECLD